MVSGRSIKRFRKRGRLSFKNKNIFPVSTAVAGFPFFYFCWGWLALFGLVLLDALWSSYTWLKLPISPWPAFGGLLFLVVLRLSYHGFFNLPYLNRAKGVIQKNHIGARFFLGAEYLVLSNGVSRAVLILTYFACALPFPLIDPSLNHIDQALGFNWPAWFYWFSHGMVFAFFKTVYYSLLFQTIFFMTWFSYMGDKKRLYELFWILLLGILLTTLVSGFLPAVGPAYALTEIQPLFYHLQPLGKRIWLDVTAIKAGINPDFSAHNPTGIITFPSFHTVCAIVYAYGFRKTGLIGYGIVLLDILVLISIPAVGNHYFVDVLAGGIIAFLSIAVVRGASRKIVCSNVL